MYLTTMEVRSIDCTFRVGTISAEIRVVLKRQRLANDTP